jgi:hypothetical protein
MEDTKLLRIYLNDHLAGSVAGLELAKRTRSSNESTPLGDYLVEFMEQVIKEQEVIEDLLDALGAGPDRMKQLAAWIAEKAGRLKLNGQITGYSDLSRLVELEGLCLGVEGKLSLWRSLRTVRERHSAVSALDLDGLIEQAELQRSTLESFRHQAAETALAAPS